MKTSNYRIVPLRTEVAEAARRAAMSGAPDHAIIIADSPQGYPAVIVALGATERARNSFRLRRSTRPSLFGDWSDLCSRRAMRTLCRHAGVPGKLSQGSRLRAYSSDHDMIDAEVVNGSHLKR